MKTTQKGLILSLSVLPILFLLFACVALAPAQRDIENTSTITGVRTLTVLHIGVSNSLLDAMLPCFQASGAQIHHLEDISRVIDVNETSLVIFEGNWISERNDNSTIHAFLKETIYRKAKLVAIGGSASNLLEALEKAGVYALGKDDSGNLRNPASSQSSAVGFKLKEAVTPSGQRYHYPSIFSSNSRDVIGIFEDLVNWSAG